MKGDLTPSVGVRHKTGQTNRHEMDNGASGRVKKTSGGSDFPELAGWWWWWWWWWWLFPRVREFGRMFHNSFPACALFVVCLFVEVEISLRTLNSTFYARISPQ